jgi:type I restriction enzyme S subunit
MLLDPTPPIEELPPGWSMVSLADACFIMSGGTPSKSNESYWRGTIPWVSGKDLKKPRLYDSIDHVSDEAIGAGTRLSPAGSVFILVRGMGLAKTLPVALALRPMAFNQDIKALVPKVAGTGAFIRAAIYHLRGRLLSRIVPSAHGTMTLNLDDIETFEIPMPHDPGEAEAISSALDLILSKAEQAEQELGALQELKRAAGQALFSKGLRGEANKVTEIGLIPNSWTPTPVVQLGTVKGGKRMPKGVSLVEEDTGRPYIRVTDFKDHGVRNESVLFVPKGYEAVIQRYRISVRDVYISIAGSIGLVGQIPTDLDNANLTENAAKIVFEREDVSPRYVMYALAGHACQDQIGRATAKNAQPKLALTRIEQILVPLPPTLDEQEEIVDILDTIDRKISLQQRKRAVVEDLFKALLHKLMTGEIRVTDLDLSALSQAAIVGAAV